MTTQNLFKRKLKDIKYKYGQKACDHFCENYICKNCGEDRLVILNIHHTNGKNVDSFETLCFNCHILEHNKKSGHLTFESCQLQVELKEQNKQKKHKNILSFLHEKIPLRNIIRLANTDLSTIRRVALENGFVIKPRVGYEKVECSSSR